MHIPIQINEYNIYDIYHNDNNNIIIISPLEGNPLNITYKDHIFDVKYCGRKHTYIYVLQNQTEYEPYINIIINGKHINTKINKYPEFKDEIIMSTIVKNEDNYIRQWIKFHYNIGITRFIIYDNSTDGTLEHVITDFINQNIVILIKWNHRQLTLYQEFFMKIKMRN